MNLSSRMISSSIRKKNPGVSTYNPAIGYLSGHRVSHSGHIWEATQDVAMGHAPHGVGDGTSADRQLLLDNLNKGWGALAGTTGGGVDDVAVPTYVVTSTADTNTSGTLRYALTSISGPSWIIFDKDVFPIDSPASIVLTSEINTYPNKTIDGRGAGVRIKKYPIKYRSDPSAPLVDTRGVHTANIIIAYVEFTDYPNESSFVTFGGNNPWNRGGGDKVYLHHVSAYDVEDQMISQAFHGLSLSRMTMDWCKFGPSPDTAMSALMSFGKVLKLFKIDSDDVTNDTITAVDASGNPVAHTLRWPFNVKLYKREDQTTYPFPSGGVLAGGQYTLRNVGLSSAPQQNFTADNTNETFTATAHGFSDGDPVVFIGSTLPSPLRTGYIYYVRDSAPNTFKISDSSGGTVRTITTDGSGTLKVQKADLTKFQLSDLGGSTWTPRDITNTGFGWYQETTEPVYYADGKGPQFGSHHDDDLQDGFATFTVDAGTDVITCTEAHGLSDGDRVRFWTQGSNLPGGITQATTYYARDVTSTTFRIAATLGGTAIDLTDNVTTYSMTVDAAGATADEVTVGTHTMTAGMMVMFTGGSLPAGITSGVVYWVIGTPTATGFQVAERKNETDKLVNITGTGSGTAHKQPPLMQVMRGPNQVSIALCDFRRMRLRSPKMQTGWYHLWNNRVYKWGAPSRGGGVGGFGNEMGDGAQSKIEYSIYTPYNSDGTEVHYWSNFTTVPGEDVLATEPSVIGINIDASCSGPITTTKWLGGAAAMLTGNLFEDGATTRNATGSTTITSASSLDWYDGSTLLMPYEYDPIDTADPDVLKDVLDLGAGNVQPWILIS